MQRTLVPGAPLLLGAVVVLTALSPCARADDPLAEDAARARATTDLFRRHLAANQAHYNSVIVPLLNPAYTEERRTAPLREARKELDGHAELLATAVAEHAQRRRDLGGAVHLCKLVGARSLKDAFKLSRNIAGAHVDGLSYRNRESARALHREHAERLARVNDRLKNDAKAREAEAASLLAEFAQRERRLIERLRKDYAAVTDRLVADRRELCGEYWKLADFHEKRGRGDVARAARADLYAVFELDLPGRGVPFHERWFGGWSAKSSDLDFFIRFPGSPDRLIVITNWERVADSPWKMDAAFLGEPVETLRRFENPPPVRVAGSVLEQVCRSLTIRLLALSDARRRLDAGFEALKAADVRARSLADFPDPAPLNAELARIIESRRRHTLAKDRFDRAGQAVARAEEALAATEREERFARSELRLVPRTLAVAAPGDQKAELASRLLAEARKQLAAATALAEAPDTPRQQREAMRQTTVPRLQGEVDRVAAAIDAAMAPKVGAVATARASRDRARAELSRTPDPGTPADVRRRWDAAKTAYQSIVDKAGTFPRFSPSPFPAEPEGEPANRCTDTLADVARRLEAARVDVRWAAAESLGDVRQADHDLRALAASVASLRAGGAALAETTLAELGAKPEDPIVAELARLKEAARETEQFCQDYNKRLGRFEKVLDKLSADARAKGLLTATRERVELFERTFGRVAGTIEGGLKLKQIRDQLADDRTVLQGIAGILELGQDAAGSVPLAGPLVAQVLGYYASAARSCGDAAVAIQRSVIEQDLAAHFAHPPPERHLYTEDELSNLRIGNENARDRVKRMLQVRRLIALLGSEDASVARELNR